MAAARTTRKVTIDSARRISSTGDLIEHPHPPKKKSVFDRLGVSNPKALVQGQSSKKNLGDSADEEYNSEEGLLENRKVISFTVKKNSLLEESENKLNSKKEKKKASTSADVGEESTKPKRKKKKVEEDQTLTAYSKVRKIVSNDDGLNEGNIPLTKENTQAPPAKVVQTVKKKRRFVERKEDAPQPSQSAPPQNEEVPKKGMSKIVVRRKSLVEYHSGSDTEGKEKEVRKKKGKQSKENIELPKRSKKFESVDGSLPKKTKSAPRISDDEDSEVEKQVQKLVEKHRQSKSRKEREPSWSLSDDEEVLKPKKKVKGIETKGKGSKQRKNTPSVSPMMERFTKDYTPLESDENSSMESDDERPRRKKKGHNKQDYDCNDDKPYEDKQRRRHDNEKQLNQRQHFDDRRKDDFIYSRKRNDSFSRDEPYDDPIDDRHRDNRYDNFRGQREDSYDSSVWRQYPYDDRANQRYDDRGKRGRMNNRYDNRFDNRDTRSQDNYRDDRLDERQIDERHLGDERHHDDRYHDDRDFRGSQDNEWNRQGSYDDGRYNNRIKNNRGRGRGRGRAGFRGNFNQYQNQNDTRYQQRDYDNCYRNDPLNERVSDNQDRYSRHGVYRDYSRDYHRDDVPYKVQPYELSPIRDPNFIGGINKKRLRSDTEDEDEDKSKKRKLSDKSKKKSSKEGSASDVSDTESKTDKKTKSKVAKSSESKESKESKETKEAKETKAVSTEKTVKAKSTEGSEVVKSPKKITTKDKPPSQAKEPKKTDQSNEKKKEKKLSHKRVVVLKETDDSTSKVTSENKCGNNEKAEESVKKNNKKKNKKEDKKDGKKRDNSTDSNRDKSENKRQRNEKRNQDDREKTWESSRSSPDNRTGKIIETKDITHKNISPRFSERSAFSDTRRGDSGDRHGYSDDRHTRSPDRGFRIARSPIRRGRSPIKDHHEFESVHGHAGHRGSPYSRRNSPNARRDSPITRDSPYTRKGSRERRERGGNLDSDRDRPKSPHKGLTGSSFPSESAQSILDIMGGDVYESISDEDLDLFDEGEEEGHLPKPASVMEVDWSKLSKMNSAPKLNSNEAVEVPEILQKLSPGHVLSEIGYAPNLLTKKTLKRVRDACLKARKIEEDSLDISEESKLRNGMAVSVMKVLKQRAAKRALFKQDLIGLRNDLVLRRELRKPTEKVGTKSNLFFSPELLQNPPDYELFSSSVDLFNKKAQHEGDPLYITIPSKVGSIIACKS